ETRAAGGGDATLQLDSITDRLAAGDRFLLCSDGLYMALDEPALLAGLGEAAAHGAAQALLAQGPEAGAAADVTEPADDNEETRLREAAQTRVRAETLLHPGSEATRVRAAVPHEASAA